jgi:hypothetical protein
MTRLNLKAFAPWLGLVIFLLVPLYLVSASFAIRTGVFDLGDKSISNEEIQAVWTLVASGLATGASIIGLLLSRSHNERMLERTALDTVVKGLELIVGADGKYAPRARIAGALAALIHLGHPVIGMRTLAAAWEEDAVDPATGVWLISQVFETGSSSSRHEAARLLRVHAGDLCAKKKGQFLWPSAIVESWPIYAPASARKHIVYAIHEVVLSRDRAWWGRGYANLMLLLDEARSKETDASVSDKAVLFLKPMLEGWQFEFNTTWSWQDGRKSLPRMTAEAKQYRLTYGVDQETGVLIKALEDWAKA